MVRHVLLIKFHHAASTLDITTCMGNFDTIQEKIKGVESVEWGINNSPEVGNKGYSHCVLMTFTDETARDHYIPHSAHESLKAQLGPILEDIIVFDYAI